MLLRVLGIIFYYIHASLLIITTMAQCKKWSSDDSKLIISSEPLEF